MNQILEERRLVKEEDERYRDAAARMSGGTVDPLASVVRPASREGAFVMVTMWVPAAEIAPETR